MRVQEIKVLCACDETDVLMPAPIHFSHKILRLMAEDRKSGKLKNIEPDSKSQVTFEYENGKPCLLYTSPSPRDRISSRMPSAA